jgi:hypothetical protein
MELSALSARIDRRGQIAQQPGVEIASGEASIELSRLVRTR